MLVGHVMMQQAWSLSILRADCSGVCWQLVLLCSLVSDPFVEAASPSPPLLSGNSVCVLCLAVSFLIPPP